MLKCSAQGISSRRIFSVGACSEIARLIGSASSASCRMRSGTPTVLIVRRRAPMFRHAGSCSVRIAFITCAILTGYALPIAFLDSSDQEKTAGVWRRKFVFSTAFSGSAWAYLIVMLLKSSEANAQAFAIRNRFECTVIYVSNQLGTDQRADIELEPGESSYLAKNPIGPIGSLQRHPVILHESLQERRVTLLLPDEQFNYPDQVRDLPRPRETFGRSQECSPR